MGYYTEVRPILRAAYESAALARYLATAPNEAERWLKENVWVPDRVVRRWLKEETDRQLYADYYSILSAATHPTAQSCVPLADTTEDGYVLRLDSDFDPAQHRDLLQEIAASAVFVCFAFRNAVASEQILPPSWRYELTRLAEDLAPDSDWSHLQRDWEREEKQWQEIAERVQPAAELDRRLKAQPPPWTSSEAEPPS